jgi:hypothetical protein
MNTRTFLGIWAGIFAIALLLWLGIYAYDNIVIIGNQVVPAGQYQPGALTAFLVARPNLIVDGSALSKVEIWAVPVSVTEISESDYKLLGNATLPAGSDPLTQIWTLPIPAEPVAATEIFAKGFDMKGEFVGQMSLPYLGATQIFNAIWAGAPAAATSSVADTQRHFSFALKVGEKATVGGLTVRLIKIESDSRCPHNAVCIWAGEVAARVQLTSGNRNETVVLHSMSVPSTFGNYQIGITGVSPTRLNTLPAQSDYRITFSVEKM